MSSLVLPSYLERAKQYFVPIKNNRFLVKGSFWDLIKIVEPGLSGEGWDDSWTEPTICDEIRKFGGIFVNDAFIPLWNKTRGLLFMDGGYGSSKTTYAITRQLVKCMDNKYHRCYYGRQVFEDAKKKFHTAIIDEIKRNVWTELFDYSEENNGKKTITYKANGNQFIPFGCDSHELLKGLANATDIMVDEINQISFASFGMLLTRLRGSGYEKQLMGMFNNCDVFEDDWVKKYVYSEEDTDDDKEKILLEAMRKIGTIKHHSIYTDNFFNNPIAYYNQLVLQAGGDPDLIEAYCNGEWGASLAKQPFYKLFDGKKSIISEDHPSLGHFVKYNSSLPLHFVWDENKNPYLPCLICQARGTVFSVIDEIAAKNPQNSIAWVTKFISEDSKYKDHDSGVFIYGDATSKSVDTVRSEDGGNFFDLVVQGLSKFFPKVRVDDSNPNVNMRGNFLNMIFQMGFDGIEIWINSKCRTLIGDLKGCPEAPDGKGKDKRKTVIDGIHGVQRWGHFSDCLDYVICKMFKEQYKKFQIGRKGIAATGGGRVTTNTISENAGKSKIELERGRQGKVSVPTSSGIVELPIVKKIPSSSRRRLSRNGYN